MATETNNSALAALDALFIDEKNSVTSKKSGSASHELSFSFTENDIASRETMLKDFVAKKLPDSPMVKKYQETHPDAEVIVTVESAKVKQRIVGKILDGIRTEKNSQGAQVEVFCLRHTVSATLDSKPILGIQAGIHPVTKNPIMKTDVTCYEEGNSFSLRKGESFDNKGWINTSILAKAFDRLGLKI